MKKHTGKALVLGSGTSGVAAANLLKQQAWQVVMADQRRPASEPVSGVAVVDDIDRLTTADIDIAVISPGFAAGHPWLTYVREQNIPMIPEFEFGVSMMPATQVIAVTGTNGKSSLVKWIADTLRATGLKAVPCGNYGVPPSALAFEQRPLDVMVLELSSFQLEQAVNFRPDIAILLNLTPNHLDRHANFEEYARAKARLFGQMEDASAMIIHGPAWEIVRPWLPAEMNPCLFGEGGRYEVSYMDGIIHRPGREPVDVRGTWWGGRPLGINAAAGVAALDHFLVPAQVIEASAATFGALPHRMEELPSFHGLRFINDSKASTLAAMAAAVASGPEKKHLIAGGILKESDISFIKELLAKTCAFVYCIGSVADQLVRAWGDVVPCANYGDLATAFAAATKKMKRGEVMLLSPGCSSFDQFSGYGERGNKFKALVNDFINMNQQEETNMQGVR